MANELRLDGLQELKAYLRQLPEHLADDAADPVEDATEVSAAQLIQSYPIGDTGNLRRGVKTTIERSRFGVIGTVKSTSPHSHLWEFGTQNRTTRQGWNRGRSPSHHRDGLIQIAQRNRKRMYQKLIDVVRKAGFEVSGAV